MYDPADSEANDKRVHFFGTEFICVERLLFPTLPDKSVLKNEILVGTHVTGIAVREKVHFNWHKNDKRLKVL